MGDAWVFDLRYGDNRWTKVPTNGRTRPPARWGHAACAVEGGREGGGTGKVVVVGGVGEEWGAWEGPKEGDAWVLDVETLRWQELKVNSRKQVEGESWARPSNSSSPVGSFPEGRSVRMLLPLPCLPGLVLGLWMPWRWDGEQLWGERVLILDTRDGRWTYLNAWRGGGGGSGLGLWRRKKEGDAGRTRREKSRRRLDPNKHYYDSDYYDSEEEEEELGDEEIGQPAVATAAMVGFGHLVIVRATQPRRAKLLRWVLPQCLGVMDKGERERRFWRLEQGDFPTWVEGTEMPVVVRGEEEGEDIEREEEVGVEEEEEEEYEEEDEEEDYEDEDQHDHGYRQRMVIVSVAGGDVCVVGPGGEEWEMVAGDCT
jgi:hypothetical protein